MRGPQRPDGEPWGGDPGERSKGREEAHAPEGESWRAWPAVCKVPLHRGSQAALLQVQGWVSQVTCLVGGSSEAKRRDADSSSDSSRKQLLLRFSPRVPPTSGITSHGHSPLTHHSASRPAHGDPGDSHQSQVLQEGRKPDFSTSGWPLRPDKHSLRWRSAPAPGGPTGIAVVRILQIFLFLNRKNAPAPPVLFEV